MEWGRMRPAGRQFDMPDLVDNQQQNLLWRNNVPTKNFYDKIYFIEASPRDYVLREFSSVLSNKISHFLFKIIFSAFL